MTTVEKLLVQIFERKSSIIEQAKQQADLYSQHLGSKLIIDGITPPAWFWSPSAYPESNGESKEELIFKLLRLDPWPPASFSVTHLPFYENQAITGDNEDHSAEDVPLYENQAITGDNEDLSAGVFMEKLISGNFNKDHSSRPSLRSEKPDGCSLDGFPEPDISVTSPKDQPGERIANIYNAPEQPLAEIHRSKSRQKALELRNTAKTFDRSSISNENIRNTLSGKIKCSLSATNMVGQNEKESTVSEHCITGSQNRADRNLGKADCRGQVKENDEYSGMRSRSNMRVPDFVRGSLGCSSDNLKDGVFSRIFQVKRTQSVHISDSGKADDNHNEAMSAGGLSTVHCQSCEDRKVDDSDCLSTDKRSDFFACITSRSGISRKCQRCGCDSSKAVISSDEYQRIDTVGMDSGVNSPQQPVYGSLPQCSNVCNKSYSSDIFKEDAFPLISEVRKTQSTNLSDSWNAEDCVCKDPKSAGPSTVCRQSCVDKNVDGLNCLTNDKCINIFAARLSRSSISSKCQSFGSDSSKANIFPENCHGIDTVMMDYRSNSHPRSVYGSPLNPSTVLVEGCSSEISKEDALLLISEVKKRQLMHLSNFGDSQDCVYKEPESAGPSIVHYQSCGDKKVDGADCLTNDGGIISTAKLSMSRVSGKFQRSLLNPSTIVAEGCDTQESILGDCQSSRENRAVPFYSSDQQNVYENEASDLEIHSYSTNADGVVLVPSSQKLALEVIDANEEDQSSEKVDFCQHVSSAPRKEYLKGSEDENEVVLNAPGSGNLKASKDKSQLVSSTPESQNFGISYAYISTLETKPESCDSMIGDVGTLNRSCGVLETMEQFPTRQSQFCPHLEGGVCSPHGYSALRDNAFVTYGAVSPCGESSWPEIRFGHADIKSWPQLKRRKLELKKSYNLTKFTFKLRKSYRTQSTNTYFQNTETNLDAAVDTLHDSQHPNTVIPSEMLSNMVEGIGSAFSSQNGEVEFCYKETNEHKNPPSIFNNQPLGAVLGSSLRMESINAQGCVTEDTSVTNLIYDHFDAKYFIDRHLSQHVCNPVKNNDDLCSVNLGEADTMQEGVQSLKWGNGEQAQPSHLSSRTQDLELIDAGQSMPVFEGFMVDAQEDSAGMDLIPDGIDFDKLQLPRNTVERASVLAEICRSASLDKSSSHFSWPFEFQGNRNSYQSEHHENFDLASNLPSDVGEQLQSSKSCTDDSMDALEGIQYSDCLPFSGAYYGLSLKCQLASPVRKPWERFSSYSGSSEKYLSSNPELTCFPIDEDASISEENKKTVDEIPFGVQEVDSSLAMHCDNRQALKDLSNVDLNSSTSVSAHEKTLIADGINCLGTKLSVTGAQDKAQSDRKNQHVNRSETGQKQTSSVGTNDGMENQTSLKGTNGIKKAKESFNRSISKPSLSIKSGLKRQDQKPLSRESKGNNIVSNVSSFIPLVQQKQARTECAGKRDVKVKALDAAETAKRLEEKKENERKRRKEALRLERAKLEEKNTRQLELEKKKKEEERKKKDAVIIAKKRQRDEEEKKEKEKKRIRLEARYRLRGQEKMPAGKAEKENQSSKEEKMNNKKESLHESKKQQNREIVRGDDLALRKANTKSTTSDIMTTYEKCGTSGQSCEVGKVMHAVDKSPQNQDLIINNGKGRSYDISPYQCSDDEDDDEEDDELRTKKSIPSWASKSSVALLLSSQQQKDPNTIFPAESFCTMGEVLRPRERQQKQVAA